jgi:hypothetical protein
LQPDWHWVIDAACKAVDEEKPSGGLKSKLKLSVAGEKPSRGLKTKLSGCSEKSYWVAVIGKEVHDEFNSVVCLVCTWYGWSKLTYGSS